MKKDGAAEGPSLPKITLSQRLCRAASFALPGRFAVDVGTDHAFLPAYLCLAGISRGAACTDIHRGPVETARKHLDTLGLSDVSVTLCDGLGDIPVPERSDIFICGMGGETVLSILEKAADAQIKREDVRLILGPQTHVEKVRKYLGENGFTVEDESILREDKFYSFLVARYTGVTETYTEIEAILGKKNIQKNEPVLRDYAAFVKTVFLASKNGKESAGKDASAEIALLAQLNEFSEKSAQGGTLI